MSAGSLTLESMRADVAAMLHMEPSEIGDDDNLMDLGLDSMRAMNLALQWGEAEPSLEFEHLAEHVTLAGWWGVVQARREAA